MKNIEALRFIAGIKAIVAAQSYASNQYPMMMMTAGRGTQTYDSQDRYKYIVEHGTSEGWEPKFVN